MEEEIKVEEQSTPHAGGRPTLYNEKMPERVKDYLASVERNNSDSKKQRDIATMEGLGFYLKVNGDTIVEWGKKYPEFSVALKEVEKKQRKQLITDGLYGGGKVSTPMAIFLLKANHGMVETEKKIVGGDPENPLKVDINTMLEKAYGDDTT